MWWGRRPAEGKPAAPTMPSTLPSPLSPLRLGVAEGRVGLGRGGLATTCLWGGHCANSLGPVVWEAAPRGQSAVPVLRPLRTSPLPGPGSPPRSPPTEVGGEAEGRVPLWFCGLASAGGANPQRGGGDPPGPPLLGTCRETDSGKSRSLWVPAFRAETRAEAGGDGVVWPGVGRPGMGQFSHHLVPPPGRRPRAALLVSEYSLCVGPGQDPVFPEPPGSRSPRP